jgi:KaiC/GvpD/RAD55 family RecA-like ATPase
MTEHPPHTPGSFTVVALPPKSGKTAKAEAAAIHYAVELGVPTLFVDSERHFGDFIESCGQKIKAATDLSLSSIPLHFLSTMGWSFDSTLEKIRKWAEFMRPMGACVVFDYIQLQDDGRTLDELLESLRTLAKELDVAMLVMVQANRSATQS